jgi:uncharacterized protein (DUF1697 family)
MARYVALLRAINVGKRIVKMDRLRGLFEEMGFSNVETFIASGQVIFEARATDTAKLEAKIEKHLRAALGYDVDTFIRTPAQLAKVGGQVDPGDRTLYVTFTKRPPDKAACKRLKEQESDVDEFAVHGTEVYWLCRTSLSKTKFTGALLEKIIGMPATARNVNTVHRLAEKYHE